MSQCFGFSDAQIEQVREWLYFVAERDGIDIREGLLDGLRRKVLRLSNGKKKRIEV